MRWILIAMPTALALGLVLPGALPLRAEQPAAAFDHQYRSYAALLRAHVEGRSVNYRKLHSSREAIEPVTRQFGAVDRATEQAWTREQRLAYWINAYNFFTLRAVADHYPIQGSWFSIYPRNSIRQIPGVWTRLPWRAGGAALTLDQIEHETIRPGFREPLVHFALSCASVSCPPLSPQPYVAEQLLTELEASARAFLASDQGLRVSGDRLSVSSLFNWYAEDFVADYARLVTLPRSEPDRAILGVIVRFGPANASAIAQRPAARLDYLDYDWSLNEARGGATTH